MRKVKVEPSFLAMLAVLLVFDENGHGLLLLLAVLFHEFGHMAVLLLRGCRIEQVRLIPGGLDIRYEEKHSSYGGDLLIAAAGPGVNLMTAMLFAPVGHPTADYFVGVNLVLCFFNLLPVYPLDGGKILYTIMTYFSPMGGGKIFFLFSGTLALLLFVLSCGACFYNLRALWSVFVFGAVLLVQKLGYIYKEAI